MKISRVACDNRWIREGAFKIWRRDMLFISGGACVAHDLFIVQMDDVTINCNLFPIFLRWHVSFNC